jgi:NAD(P)-dependent dehydrogenase (short-subunit alcohol dehydrogenase family)
MAVILVTGSSRGIGAATRDALNKRGVTVIGHCSHQRPTGPEPDDIPADFTDPLAAQALWETALERGGGHIDAVINNAGLFEANRIDRSDIEWLDAWEDTLRINLTASAQLSRFAVRHWIDGDAGADGVRGRLVHIASRAAYRGDSPSHWHYAAAKGGMVALHKTIARAYASMGVLSFAVAPGFTDTSMAGDYLESRGGPGLLADIPLGRVAEPWEIARIAAFCALDAPPSMTGAVLDANGASFVR